MTMNRFKAWLRPSECPVEGCARFRRLALASVVVAATLVVGWLTLPAWGMPADMLPRFQNMFLMFAAAFAIFSGGCLGAAALTKRGLY